MLLLKLLIGGLILALLTWVSVLAWNTFSGAEQVSDELQELQDALKQALKKKRG